MDDKTAVTREFLYKSLDDAQNTIRSLDSKTGIGIVVLGAMIGAAITREEIAAIRASGLVSILIALIFAALCALSAVFAFRTVFPTINPAANISLPKGLEPPFFIHELRPRRFWRLFSSNPQHAKLALTHESYIASLRAATADTIEAVMAAEVLKVSFIRQMKTDRLAAFAKALTVTVIAFVVLLLAVPSHRDELNLTRQEKCGGTNIEVGPTTIVNGQQQPTRGSARK